MVFKSEFPCMSLWSLAVEDNQALKITIMRESDSEEQERHRNKWEKKKLVLIFAFSYWTKLLFGSLM